MVTDAMVAYLSRVEWILGFYFVFRRKADGTSSFVGYWNWWLRCSEASASGTLVGAPTAVEQFVERALDHRGGERDVTDQLYRATFDRDV